MARSRSCTGRQQVHRRLSVVHFPTTDEIAARAHELFVADGRRVRKIQEYWQKAEQELLLLASRRLLDRV